MFAQTQDSESTVENSSSGVPGRKQFSLDSTGTAMSATTGDRQKISLPSAAAGRKGGGRTGLALSAEPRLNPEQLGA
jgi:hypothetical protein